ncbi:MAG: HypC/HybG/HupF family hydrogenase formation chaperone [Patescibacteria group bacterium]|nr:HypC/HybG/HupF family hydrogenase formation chaperone [Patescibacteria group bacterium]MBU1160401.1 HypC/HybG/HupF family hydrogenase formation chaperone [Patescibacteria group bacterium]MBU1349717.1 HypC/HybG/HupF family hydrogenase formation chaperone [Patescibacteria group bacterium]MBU1420867.1 HypC/HybG/HupF family hydrogenase formation chaperone [Patescibacteria group bacterium]MBU1684489.1 HypC/HybG/HupF family hydrogenase formation chaperone [Patescibacteria group bacterium]
MCISIPGKVILIKGGSAKIKQDGHFHWADISSLEDEIKKGDYLITYQETAINKISPKDAEEILRLMDSASDARVKSSN